MSNQDAILRHLTRAAVGLGLSAPCLAQCLTWSSAFPHSQSVGDDVNALVSFDDGSGPALYVGGAFWSAAGVPVNHVARYSGGTWSVLGAGTDAPVTGLAVFDDGTGPALYACGGFLHAGNVATRGIAKWNGSSWSDVGGGLDGMANVIVVHDDGSGPALYVGGSFSTAGGIPADHFARWDGTNWSALAPHGIVVAQVWSLASYDDGGGPALYASGERTIDVYPFHVPFTDQYRNSQWSGIGGGTDYVLRAADLGNGTELYAGGLFNSTIGNNITRRSNAAGHPFVPLGAGTNGTVNALAVFDDGSGPSLFVGGSFTQAGGQQSPGIARWDGTNWHAVGGGLGNLGTVNALLSAIDNGQGVPDLFVGGHFGLAGGNPSVYIAEWFGCGNTGSAFCFGDGVSGTACPCGNNSPFGADAGCLNSFGTGGKLTASGHASIALDTFALRGTDMPATASALYFQGTSQENGGSGSIFGDGLRCVSGSVVRLGTKLDAGGASSYPESGDAPIHVRGAVSAGNTRDYQAWYRNSAAFCSPAQFNLTNGWSVTWHP